MTLPAIKPMVLTRFSEPFSHPDWLYEVKHDGFRALAYVVDGDCRLVGRAQFNELMFRRGDPHFYGFDLLWLNGEDLRCWQLVDRKRLLRKILPRGSRLLYVDHVVGRGKELFQLACAEDLEGVVAKWRRGKYMEGDRTSWVKIKNRRYSQSVGREKLFEKKDPRSPATSATSRVPDPHLGDSSPLESTARVGAVARVPYPLSSVDVVTWTRLTLLHLFFAFFGVNA